MNNRIGPIVGVAILLSLSSGCTNLRNALFGRGARCGLCTPNPLNVTPAPDCPTCPTPIYPAPVYQTPTYQTPTYQAPAYQTPPCQTPNCQHVAPAYQAPPCQVPSHGGDCGCNNYGSACGNCEASVGGTVHGGGCGCGNVYNNDPYLSGGNVPYENPVNGSMIYGNEVYEGQVIDGSIQGGQVSPDNFERRSNKVDTDGNKILWEEPLPAGSTPL